MPIAKRASANKPIVKALKNTVKTEKKALNAGLKAVKKSDKMAVKNGAPSMFSKKTGK
jgi:hypothetical protein